MPPAKKDFFKPGRAASLAKAELTNSASKQIVDAEEVARKKKTASLRAQRLGLPAPALPAASRKKKGVE